MQNVEKATELDRFRKIKNNSYCTAHGNVKYVLNIAKSIDIQNGLQTHSIERAQKVTRRHRYSGIGEKLTVL